MYGNYTILSEPLLQFEEDQASDEDKYAYSDNDRISIRRLQFRHMDEVHAVPSGDERKRHEDARNDRENSHYPVLLQIDLSLVKISYLCRII